MRKYLIALGLAAALSLPTAQAETKGILTTKEEVMLLPTSGPAWDSLLAEANRVDVTALLANGSSSYHHDHVTLAAALVWLRTGDTAYRDKALQGVRDIIGTEEAPGENNNALSYGKNLGAYIYTADIIDLATLDPATDALFRPWVHMLYRYRPTDNPVSSDRSMRQGVRDRTNDWGAEPGKSNIAAMLYLGVGDGENEHPQEDWDDMIFWIQAWFGEHRDHDRFQYQSDSSWRADPDSDTSPIINPEGARHPSDGGNIDGVHYDGMRQGRTSPSYTWPPYKENYAYQSMIGKAVAVYLLERAGYPAKEWGSRAVFRNVRWLNETIFDDGTPYAVHLPSEEGTSSGTCLPFITNALYPREMQYPTVTPCGASNDVWGWDWLLGPKIKGVK